ncbi:MAG: FecR domain-containing protein [Balneolaceae bacterium]|nr:FecR domain-containing protein [Balneolaceae bacterium]
MAAVDEAHGSFLEMVSRAWQVTPDSEVDINFDEEWKEIESRLGEEFRQLQKQETASSPRRELPCNTGTSGKIISLKQFLRVAAVILVILLPAYFLLRPVIDSEQPAPTAEIAMQKIETAKGERATMEFSDGSRVTLNSMSTLQFPKVFDGERVVYLDGEAFFRVTHWEDLPFIVHSGEVSVRVLGTELNVNAYRDDPRGTVEVVVSDGKVAVSQNQPDGENLQEPGSANQGEGSTEVILTTGQRTRVSKSNTPTAPENVSLAPYLAWVNGRMTFEGAPLEKVMRRLNRYYGPGVRGYRFHAAAKGINRFF